MTADVNSRVASTLVRRTLLVLGLLLTACAKQETNLPRSVTGESTTAPKNSIPSAARALLEHADQFELLSLSPRLQQGSPEGSFHSYNVLGKTVITDAEIQKRLVTAFETGVVENDGEVRACFNPRHGISVMSGGRRADFVICFECRQVQVFGAVVDEFLVSASPQPIFDQVLHDAQVAQAER